MSLNRTLSVQSPSPGPQAKQPGGLHTWELPVTDRTGVWLSPVAAGFSGPAWQTLGLVGPAPSIYDLQGSLFCLSVPPSPSGLRSVFSRLPWVIIKRLPLGPLLEGLGWKFLWQGNFSTKLCACSLLTSFPPPNILPSLSHPRPISVGNSPPALLRILQPQTQVRSGTEELGQGMGGGALCPESFIPAVPLSSPPPPVPPCFLWKVVAPKGSACEERPSQTSKQQAGLPEEADRHSGGPEASKSGSSGNETALCNNEGDTL